jgi:iron complex transport system ATP-binding protein
MVEHLHVAYDEGEVVRDVSLEVCRGEFVALVGPNGCGKSTLLKAITRVVPWAAGEVFLAEVSARSLSARSIARSVAVVPQNPLLPVGYTALEIVLMGRTPHLGFFDHESPLDYQKAGQALGRVGAGDLAHRRVDQLSGGERQNVILARALAQEAPILLLDEPTANLDISHQIAVARLLRDLTASGVAVLAAIHDLTLASLYCDRLLLMSEGRILASGPPEEVVEETVLAAVYGCEVTVIRDAAPRPIVAPMAR